MTEYAIPSSGKGVNYRGSDSLASTIALGSPISLDIFDVPLHYVEGWLC